MKYYLQVGYLEMNFFIRHIIILVINIQKKNIQHIMHILLMKKLLRTYDKLYLNKKPECHHQVSLINKSEHFGITQINIICP